MLSVTGLDAMEPCAGLCYVCDNLMPDVCSLIKPTAVEKLMSFCAKIPSHIMIKSPRYTGGDFMFLYRFVRRRRR